MPVGGNNEQLFISLLVSVSKLLREIEQASQSQAQYAHCSLGGFPGLCDEDSKVLLTLGAFYQQPLMRDYVNMDDKIQAYKSEKQFLQSCTAPSVRACVFFYVLIARSLVLNCSIFLGEI